VEYRLVRDATALPGVTLTVRSVETGATRTTTADAGGGAGVPRAQQLRERVGAATSACTTRWPARSVLKELTLLDISRYGS
jgi:hypothetical protein